MSVWLHAAISLAGQIRQRRLARRRDDPMLITYLIALNYAFIFACSQKNAHTLQIVAEFTALIMVRPHGRILTLHSHTRVFEKKRDKKTDAAENIAFF